MKPINQTTVLQETSRATLHRHWVPIFIFLAANLLLTGAPGETAAQTTLLDVQFDKGSISTEEFEVVGNPILKSYSDDAKAVFLDGSSYLKYRKTDQRFQFPNGSTITMDAWVAPHSVVNGQQIYILGKGRTGRSGFAKDNQNYALRLRGINGLAKASFLFRSVNPKTGKQQFHRWNSKLGFAADGSWNHVAIQYEFGKPETIRAWINGKVTRGDWDMGGPTADPPVTDRDELWIGSSLGGSSASTFAGWIKRVRVFRDLGSDDPILAIANNKPRPFPIPSLDNSILKDGKVWVEIIEQVPERNPPFLTTTRSSERFRIDALALDGLPKKYARPGVIADRTPTFLVRSRIRTNLAPGKYDFLIRAKSATALLIGNRVIGSLPMMKRNASGHEPVPKLISYDQPHLYPPPAGHQEKTITHTINSDEQFFRAESLVGGKGLRNELGEFVVAYRKHGTGPFHILSNNKSPLPLTFETWKKLSSRYGDTIRNLEKEKRRLLAKLDLPFWEQRHSKAAILARENSPELDQTSIDRLLAKAVEKEAMQPLPLVDEATFLRRVYFDIVGVPPTYAELQDFLRDDDSQKRAKIIDHLLDSPEYADHWVSYWQDVLAENPGILKPKLNNTGPFRFWIYESLLDNKPMDRFAAELIGMKGSRTGGGPAGFGQATQNDVPTAAKANVLSRAFLGIDLTCARCHDSPSSHFIQQDLFEMAAMLNRKPITLPESSSVPNAGNFAAVKVSLKPGTQVSPKWPFKGDLDFAPSVESDDSRRQLAELITSPDNQRFSKVVANRIWTRIIGVGLVDTPDDFLLGEPRHPELLNYLSDYLRANQYDAKQLIRLILNSKAYQRECTDDSRLIKSFAGRKVKSLSAEQVVDSLFHVAGKQLELGQISFDPEGRRTADTFLNLGNPRRAWELVSLANERDRPALALPRAQSIVDVLSAFGWRESRPNPITEREDTLTLVQPLVLSNGSAAHRVTQLSDDSRFTEMALKDIELDALIDQVYWQVIGRAPSSEESGICRQFLGPGFKERQVPGAPSSPNYARQFRTAVSWSNHLHPEATRIKQRIEKAVRRGDFATKRLTPDWRERMEDVIWALINSPEFLLIR